MTSREEGGIQEGEGGTLAAASGPSQELAGSHLSCPGPPAAAGAPPPQPYLEEGPCLLGVPCL